MPEDKEETALTIRGRKKRLKIRNFSALGAAFKLTERQITNVLRRFEKGVAGSKTFFDGGYCSPEMREKYQKLVEDRWRQLL